VDIRYEIVQLLRESTLIQGSVALTFTLVIAYMTVRGMAVPSDVWSIYTLVLGYYFGSKSSQQTNTALREAMANIHVREA
jgi:hypothetical protein